ncbi:MAG: iron-containing alcohol dehydrogenase [Candidatus Omnitrophica bacterium]|nr:iron-containing alcohol dehydrogenase [Candidatus Omnitrophota bacterium]
MTKFSVTTKIFFGKEASNEVKQYLSSLGMKNIAFIIDSSIKDLKASSQVISDYKKHGFLIDSEQIFTASCEPSYDDLDVFTEKFRSYNLDGIIAIGGGSIMDIAKGVGILLKNPGKGINYRGMDKVENPGVKVICYPTTAGTGSEVTHTASFIDKSSMTKLGINGRYVAPICGVLVPELTFTCPDKATVSSGLDAMLHAIEAVSAKTANAITSLLGREAFSMLFSNFREAIKNPHNYEAREAMLLGSYYAGMAMMNAGGGPASAAAYPLGVHFKVPHGIAGGIFLPHVFEFNIKNGYKGYAEAYNCLPEAVLSLSEQEKSKDFVMKFKSLYADIKAPHTLLDYGVKKSDINNLVTLTMTQRLENVKLNPVLLGENEIFELFKKVI